MVEDTNEIVTSMAILQSSSILSYSTSTGSSISVLYLYWLWWVLSILLYCYCIPRPPEWWHWCKWSLSIIDIMMSLKYSQTFPNTVIANYTLVAGVRQCHVWRNTSLRIYRLTVSSNDVRVVNLRNSSQPEETDTVDVLALDTASVARLISAVSPAMVPAERRREGWGGDMVYSKTQVRGSSEHMCMWEILIHTNSKYSFLRGSQAFTNQIMYCQVHAIFVCLFEQSLLCLGVWDYSSMEASMTSSCYNLLWYLHLNCWQRGILATCYTVRVHIASKVQHVTHEIAHCHWVRDWNWTLSYGHCIALLPAMRSQ